MACRIEVSSVKSTCGRGLPLCLLSSWLTWVPATRSPKMNLIRFHGVRPIEVVWIMGRPPILSSKSSKQLLGISLLSLLLNLTACAASPADARSSTPGRVTEVRQICANTMDLNPANADYAMCVASLLQTLAGLSQAELLNRDRRVCGLRGLLPGSSEYARCQASAEQGLSAPIAGMQ